eukprot:GILI01020480.1.p1 GENE.GILI01020480.1~~GILI01020480.1.p1  ORF type:complete len:260 (+),score=76.91 GILI01020480.1:91-780(+)
MLGGLKSSKGNALFSPSKGGRGGAKGLLKGKKYQPEHDLLVDTDDAAATVERKMLINREKMIRKYRLIVKVSCLVQMVVATIVVGIALAADISSAQLTILTGSIGFIGALIGFFGAEFKIRILLFYFFVLEIWTMLLITLLLYQSLDDLNAVRNCSSKRYIGKIVAVITTTSDCDATTFRLVAGFKTFFSIVNVFFSFASAMSSFALSEQFQIDELKQPLVKNTNSNFF